VIRLKKFFLLPFAVAILCFSFAACTRTSSKTPVGSTGTFGDDSAGYGDDSSFTGTSGTTGTTGTSGNMSNLFNSDLDDQENVQNGTLQSSSLTGSSQQCLANGYNPSSSNSIFYDDEYQGTGLNNAGSCLASNSAPVDAERFYDSGLQTLDGMEQCLNVAMMLAPQSEQDAEQAHMLGRMVLFRCFRNLAEKMQRDIPWNQEQNQVIGNFRGNMNNMVYRSHQGQF